MRTGVAGGGAGGVLALNARDVRDLWRRLELMSSLSEASPRIRKEPHSWSAVTRNGVRVGQLVVLFAQWLLAQVAARVPGRGSRRTPSYGRRGRQRFAGCRSICPDLCSE